MQQLDDGMFDAVRFLYSRRHRLAGVYFSEVM